MDEDSREQLRSLVYGLSPEQRTALLRGLRRGAATASEAPPRPPESDASAAGHVPAGSDLSHGQQRVWLLEQLRPREGLTVEVEVFHVEGPLEPRRFDRSLAAVIRRHDALRSSFSVQRGRVRCEVAATLPLPLEHVDLADLPAAEQHERVLAWQLGDRARGFDLATPPLFRACLFRLGPEAHVLCIAAHHIICDGWSIRVLLADLARAYRSADEPWSGPAGSGYADFVAWERSRLDGAAGGALRDHWARTLAEAPAEAALPLDRPRPPQRRFEGRRIDHALAPALRDRGEALGRARGASPFMVGLAAFDALLWSVTGQRDLVVATPVANREQPELHEVIGCFVNTVPVRVRLRDERGFDALLDEVRASVLAALDHQALPYDEIVRAGGPASATRPSPCNVMFVHEEQLAPVRLSEGIEVRLGQQRADRGRSMFDLLLWVSARSDGWVATAEYDSELLDEASVRELLARYERTLAAVIDDPGRPLAELLGGAPPAPGGPLADVAFSFERAGGPR